MVTHDLKERKRRWNRIKLKQKYNKFRKTNPNFWLSETPGGTLHPFRVSVLKIHFLLSVYRVHHGFHREHCSLFSVQEQQLRGQQG